MAAIFIWRRYSSPLSFPKCSSTCLMNEEADIGDENAITSS